MNHLFSPLTLRGVTFKNRLAVSPMQQYSSPDGMATDWHLVHLGSRAVGGAGLVMTEVVAVSAQGRLTPEDLGLWNDRFIGPLERITAFLKAQGAVPGIQIGHGGAKSSRTAFRYGNQPLAESAGGWPIVGASAVAPYGGMAVAQQLTLPQLRAVVADFGQAARRAAAAGFEVLEIHAGYGYLLHQFLSPLINGRADAYGGTWAHRTRLLREVVSEVRQYWPAHLPLFVRVSATDFAETGTDSWTLADTVALSVELGPLGVDLVTCVGGGFRWPPAPAPGHFVGFAEAVKRAGAVYAGAVGLITTAAQADAIIREDRADLVLVASEHLRDPYFALHAAQALGVTVPVPYQYQRAF